MSAAGFDRTLEDLGNVVELGHVNVRVPDQALATWFYVMGIGLTRDPYLPFGRNENTWINAGRAQFHLPTGDAQVFRGRIGLIVPDLGDLERRFKRVAGRLEGTQFHFERRSSYVDARCPWGNRIRIHEPDEERFGPVALGMPYVEFDVPAGTAGGIVRFYREVLGALASLDDPSEGRGARVAVGDGQDLVFRETSQTLPAYDGHHVMITCVDFSGPHRRLLERGLITEESDQHQYRFEQIVDPQTNRPLFTVEHEVRSMRHPLYGRPLVNRNPAMDNNNFRAGNEEAAWALPPV